VLRRSKVEKVSWTPVEADLGVNWDEAEAKVDEQEVIDDMTTEATLIEEVDDKLEAGTNRLSNAQLEKIDRATETLESSNKGLAEALAKGEPLGRLFIKSLEQFVQDRERTLELLTLNRLNNSPAAQDLEAALGKTRNLLQEYRSLEARPLAYRAVVQGLELARNLEAQLNASSALIDQRRAKADLDRIELALREPMPKSARYQELQNLFLEVSARVANLDFADADLPVPGMSKERNANFDAAISELDDITSTMKSSNLRAGSKDSAALAKQGSTYRRAILNAGKLLSSTPASMQSTSRFQEAQQAFNEAKDVYRLWARKNNQSPLAETAVRGAANRKPAIES
jgi:hypothetical protein